MNRFLTPIVAFPSYRNLPTHRSPAARRFLSRRVTLVVLIALIAAGLHGGCAFDAVRMEHYAERVQTDTLFDMAESAVNMIADMSLYQSGADISQIESDRRLALEVLGRFRTLLRKAD